MGYQTDLKLFIDGIWKSADAGHTVVNPVDAKPIAEVPFATKADLDEALAASERAWPAWRALDVEKRGAILHKTSKLLAERADPSVDPHALIGLSGGEGATLAGSKAYRIEVDVELPAGQRSGGEVVILLLESGDEPYRVLSWRNNSDGSTAPQKASLR